MKSLNIFALSALLAMPVNAHAANIVCNITSDLGNKVMVASVTQEALEKTPKWIEGTDNPPLAPGVAVTKAKKYAEQFNELGLKIVAWDITLKHLAFGKYLYVVQIYFYPKNGVIEGFTLPLNIVVLMDGTVVPLVEKPRDKDSE